MNSNIQLKYVDTMPIDLVEGILYVSKEFQVAIHLCPCGCLNKIVTPLDDCEWDFHDDNGKPTLYPSVGNWQIPCKSHYWIKSGAIEWSYQWSEAQIVAGYRREQERRELYYSEKTEKAAISLWRKIWIWVRDRVLKR